MINEKILLNSRHRRGRGAWTRLLFTPLTVFALSIPTLLCAQDGAKAGPDRHPPHVNEQVGSVSFPNSGALAAQRDFLRGIALLHNFEYDDASRAFGAAEKRDPSFALAFWFDAMTHSHLLWSEEDLAGARATLTRLSPDRSARIAKAKTPRERAYGAAIEAFFADAAEATRARAFADSMRHVAAAYPSDMEAQAFGALAIMIAGVTANSVGESNRLFLEAASYAERVFRAHPDHPGAAHYLIHAYDDPARAAQGLEAARAYSRIAPSAEHAQHMPSHIFVQVGYWDDAVHSNEQAWASSHSRVIAEHAPATDLDFHTLNWLEYAYLQQGRYREARALVDTARVALSKADLTGFDQPDARFAVAQLQFKYMRETGDWKAWPIAALDTSELSLPANSSQRARMMAAAHLFETAVVLAMRGDSAPIALVARRLHEQAGRGGATMPPGQRARLAMFDALIARARGDRNAAITLLERAQFAADSAPPIGPVSLLPIHELLGTLLSDAGRHAESAAAFNRALVLTPGRSAALLGLARAEQRSGHDAASKDAYSRLKNNWARADAVVLQRIAGEISR